MNGNASIIQLLIRRILMPSAVLFAPFFTCGQEVPEGTDEFDETPVVWGLGTPLQNNVNSVSDTVLSDAVIVERSNTGIVGALKQLPFLFDDVIFVGGVLRSGLYYTPNYEEISHVTGWKAGAETYFPLFPRAFIHSGLYFARRGFAHSFYDVSFFSDHLEIPLLLSYELPELERMDWRFITGIKFSHALSTRMSGVYDLSGDASEFFQYNPGNFNRPDWGFYYGMSMEFRNLYFRAGIYTGVVKIDPADQGMRSVFSFDAGFFLFRSLRSN